MKTQTYLVDADSVPMFTNMMESKGIEFEVKEVSGCTLPADQMNKLNLLSGILGMGEFKDMTTFDIEVTCIDLVHNQLEQLFCTIH